MRLIIRITKEKEEWEITTRLRKRGRLPWETTFVGKCSASIQCTAAAVDPDKNSKRSLGLVRGERVKPGDVQEGNEKLHPKGRKESLTRQRNEGPRTDTGTKIQREDSDNRKGTFGNVFEGEKGKKTVRKGKERLRVKKNHLDEEGSNQPPE